MYQGKSLIRTWRRIRRLLQARARSFALQEEEIEIQPRPFMRSYWLNETAESHQQPLVEEQPIKRDSSNLQATISQAQLNEVIKPMPPIPSSKEENLKLMPVCNQGEFFVEPKKVEQSIALEEVSPTDEIFEEKNQSLEECNRVVHDKLLEILPPMKDN